MVLRGYTDSSLKSGVFWCGVYICSNSVNFVVENKGRIPEYVKIIAPKCRSQNVWYVCDISGLYYVCSTLHPHKMWTPLIFFIQVLYTLQEKEYKGNSHLAKKVIILRLPETKSEKEMNTYKFSERDVQAPIEINRT